MASIFDLYSRKPKFRPYQHGPYEFSKKQVPKASPSDPFLSTESPQRHTPKETKLPPRLGPYHLVIREVSGGGSIQVIRRKPLEPTVSESLPSLLPAASIIAESDTIPVPPRESNPHGYMENRKYWDNLEQQLTRKLPSRNRQLRKSKTMASFQLARSFTTLSIKAPAAGGHRSSVFAKDCTEEEGWKRDIRLRATALVHAMKGAPKAKKYMGQ